MKRLLVLISAVAALAVPAAALGHPLGNFTISHYSGIDVSGTDVYLHYALDFAEIPTFQDGERVRGPGFASALAKGIVLRIDGRRTRLTVVDTHVRERPGAGGLSTLLFEAVYRADRTGSSLSYRDTNFSTRLGWREVVVTASEGARLERSTAPAASISEKLRTYPKNLLQSPLDLRTASVAFQPGDEPGVAPVFGEPAPARKASGGFEALIERENLSAGFILVSLLLALFWGAAHALTPGHGKAIVAAYLVGTRGTARHAALLGLIVTVTHTIGVFALGLVTLALSEFIVPDQLYPWLNLVSALLVVALGVTVLRFRILGWIRGKTSATHHPQDHRHDHHYHHHHHHHGHGHHDHGPGGHSHVPEPGSGFRGLVAVGVSGGLLPCPTALVVLLAAISLHRVAYGLVLIVAFSVGLAAVISGIGLLAIGARRTFSRMSFEGPVVRALPAVSAVVIVGLGLAMTIRSLPALT